MLIPSAPDAPVTREVFGVVRQELADLDYVEGKSVVFEQNYEGFRAALLCVTCIRPWIWHMADMAYMAGYFAFLSAPDARRRVAAHRS